MPAPFRLDLTVWALRRRPHNAVDRWDGTSYRRTLVLGGRPVEVSVRQSSVDQPRPCSWWSFARLERRTRRCRTAEARRLLDRTLGLGRRPRRLLPAGRARRTAYNAGRHFSGMRPPLLSERLRGGSQRHRLPAALARGGDPSPQPPGGPLRSPSLHRGAVPGFPTPERLADADPQALRDLGFSWNEGPCRDGLAGQVASGDSTLKSLRDVDDEPGPATLVASRDRALERRIHPSPWARPLARTARRRRRGAQQPPQTLRSARRRPATKR